MRIHAVLVGLILLAGPLAAAETDNWVPSPVSLPRVVARLPRSEFTAADFRQAVRVAALTRPGVFRIEDGFLQEAMLRSEARRRGIGLPSQAAVETRMQEEIAAIGGEAKFAESLARGGWERADFARGVSVRLLFEEIVRRRKGLGPQVAVDDDEARAVLASLEKEYDPVWHGLDDAHAQRAATVGGRNYSREEVTDWLIGATRISLLRETLDTAIDERLLLEEAAQRGVDPVGKNRVEVLDALFFEKLQPEALELFGRSLGQQLDVIRVRYILFSARETTARGGGAKKDLLRAAEAALEQLAAGAAEFTELATPVDGEEIVRRGGELGYLAADPVLARMVPPEAYGLDMLRSGETMRSPLVAVTNGLEPLYRAVMKLQNGAAGGPVSLPQGVALVQRRETRSMRRFGPAMPYLRARRLHELTRQLLREQRVKCRFFWQPRADADSMLPGDAAAPLGRDATRLTEPAE